MVSRSAASGSPQTKPQRAVARIDQNAPVNFTFDGRSYRGFAGDTLASALLANNVHLVGRSFKYHRHHPQYPLSFSPNAYILPYLKKSSFLDLAENANY